MVVLCSAVIEGMVNFISVSLILVDFIARGSIGNRGGTAPARKAVCVSPNPATAVSVITAFVSVMPNSLELYGRVTSFGKDEKGMRKGDKNDVYAYCSTPTRRGNLG